MNPGEFRLIVSSGPTREWIDPVRFISNPSSGKTGWHLAALGVERFQETCFVSGPGAPEYRAAEGARNIAVESTQEMGESLASLLREKSVLVMAAAPADYTPRSAPSKIKKKEAELVLHLQPAMDILSTLKDRARELSSCYLVGFAAETENLYENAYGKLKRKGLSFICANQVYKTDRGFGENDNEWLVINEAGESRTLGPAPKETLARALLDQIIAELPG